MAARLGRWARGHAPELCLFALGLALRISMLRFPLTSSYDFQQHNEYVAWIVKHWTLPSLTFNFESFQPPLFYVVAASLVRAGLRMGHLGSLQVTIGCLRLALIWAGLELYLRRSRLARCAALALTAVMSTSIHLEGMLGNEALNTLLAAVVLVTAPLLFRRATRRRWLLAAVVGAALGGALLTKYSAVTLVGGLLAGVGLELFLGRAPLHLRVRKLAPWALAFTVALLVCGGWYRRNYILYGKVFPTAFDGVWRNDKSRTSKLPYWKRRPPEYFVRWPSGVFDFPYWPTAGEHPQSFLPLVIASTFGDYYGYGFAAAKGTKGKNRTVNGQTFPNSVVPYAGRSVAGGVVIAVTTVVAWLVAMVAVLRRRSGAGLFLLLVPFLLFLGQMHFSTAYPFNNMGHIKGMFLQCGAPPLLGLFGLAMARTWRRFWPAAVAMLAAVAMVGAFSIYCRFILL